MVIALMLAALNPPAGDSIESLVAQLGPQSDYRSVEAIGNYRCRAVPALVRQLETVRTYRILGWDWERHPRELRIVWTLATLRHITGRDFYAPLRRRLDFETGGEQMLVNLAPPNRIKFYGIWMSRGSIYFSTLAEQRTIIRQWRAYSASGACLRDWPNYDFMFYLYGGDYRPTEPRSPRP